MCTSQLLSSPGFLVTCLFFQLNPARFPSSSLSSSQRYGANSFCENRADHGLGTGDGGHSQSSPEHPLRLESKLFGAAAGQSGKEREAYLQARNSVPGGLA